MVDDMFGDDILVIAHRKTRTMLLEFQNGGI